MSGQNDGSQTQRVVTQWFVFPIAATIAACASFASPSQPLRTSLGAIVASFLLPVAILARPLGVSFGFRLTIAAIGVFTAVGSLLRLPRFENVGPEWLSPAANMVASLLLIAATGQISRNRRGRGFKSLLADGAIIATAVTMLYWVFVANNHKYSEHAGTWQHVVNSINHPLGPIMALLLFTVVFADARRSLSMWLLSAAVICSISSNVFAMFAEGVTGLGARGVDAFKILSIGFTAGAFVHSSVTSLSERQPVEARRPLHGRILFASAWATAAFIAMAAMEQHGGTDQIIRGVTSTALSLLVLLRALQSILANRSAQDRLQSLAETDPLTGLGNRGYLLERMDSFMCYSWRQQGSPTVFFIDVDRFKNINDSLGHASGDHALIMIAERFAQLIPERAVIARIAGDEFVIFDPDSPSPQAALELAEQLLATLAGPLALDAGDVFVTASIGVAQIDAQSIPDAETLLRNADTAMYRAKALGRNRLAIFDDSMHERVAHRLAVETALYRALDRRELRLYHQPIMDMAAGTVIGFEALMRWQREDGSIVSPAEFIPIAEETGTIVSLGAWALEEALKQLRYWIDEGVCCAATTMSVNVSPQQLADPRFPERVNEALLMSKVSPHLLWLEITEGVMISQPDLALAHLRRLRSLGVRIALDDFGMGYSSLSRLQEFPLQRIKIDRAFVHNLADSANAKALVRTIIAMGQSLDLDIVAEGVELPIQLEILRELGCTKAQGYLLSRPVPAEAMRTTVRALDRMNPWALSKGQAAAELAAAPILDVAS